MLASMPDLCRLILAIAGDLLRSRVALEAEILVLRQQINVLRRANPKRLRFVSIDRLMLGGVCRLFGVKRVDHLNSVRHHATRLPWSGTASTLQATPGHTRPL
jgi:hypothetical protein